ncbi:VapE domain-containing protein [Larkinella rosea]|uniref:Virulence-associated protein E-like domain-containing protein n=1 Tax=Larkinella rosea TaxID=2025312 RepID=A0A3P1BSL2_9BACT|nr:VapE domain-containing protein [Larkinella rosea]RRB03899.1 hypothetical protein EHT25_10210 [Larkinella rosea]
MSKNNNESQENKRGPILKYKQIQSYLFDKYDLRFNSVSVDIEYKLKGEIEWKVMNPAHLSHELYMMGFTGFDKMLSTLITCPEVEKYDPIKEYFESLPAWNSTMPDYIDELLNYIEVGNNQDEINFFKHQFKMMLVRVVALALDKISFNKHCFTLVGPQNDGKTSFFRFLCPPKLKKYMKENIEFEGKDGERSLAENLFINLDELATFSKYDINKAKSYFTKDQIKVRLPYDKSDSYMRRRASFFASTNQQEFLTDSTGSVRWLIFEVKTIKHDNGGPQGYCSLDINKIWSHAVGLLKSGYRYNLTQDEITYSGKNNVQYQNQTNEMVLISKYYIGADKNTPNARFMTATEIELDLRVKTENKIKLGSQSIGTALSQLGIKRDKKRIGPLTPFGYYLLEQVQT